MAIGVIIVAGGRGERLGATVPKQFLDLGGRSMLQRSIDAFDHHPRVSEIVVVLPADLVATAASIVGATSRRCRYVAGGDRRQDSVRHGFEALPHDVDVVLVHDAARPFVPAAVIDRVIDALGEAGAVVPALAARDTVKRGDAAGHMVVETIPRQHVWLAQTPQGFRRHVLAAAMALGEQETEATDDVSLAERAGHAVRIVLGDGRNVKITTPDDLAAARAGFVAAPRVGTGYDLHVLVEGRPLVFAGVVVPFERGPLGHSDGDVICHAIVDAVLGAAGAGDIGQRFPNTDPAWKDAAGVDLLARAIVIAREGGWTVTNVDVTVILERPKLAPHVRAIRERLAAVLQIGLEAVSVKAKTNEGVDAVGRGEAVAAHAVAVLRSGSVR
jgi:2-C-methyl-D-erythritol 4-phosphate cytidylyltransferase/2-C-methyl-D-erythritol 2,4-cyclodiphosphate synthase